MLRHRRRPPAGRRSNSAAPQADRRPRDGAGDVASRAHDLIVAVQVAQPRLAVAASLSCLFIGGSSHSSGAPSKPKANMHSAAGRRQSSSAGARGTRLAVAAAASPRLTGSERLRCVGCSGRPAAGRRSAAGRADRRRGGGPPPRACPPRRRRSPARARIRPEQQGRFVGFRARSPRLGEELASACAGPSCARESSALRKSEHHEIGDAVRGILFRIDADADDRVARSRRQRAARRGASVAEMDPEAERQAWRTRSALASMTVVSICWASSTWLTIWPKRPDPMTARCRRRPRNPPPAPPSLRLQQAAPEHRRRTG